MNPGTVPEMFTDVKAFETKLKNLIKHVSEGNFSHLPSYKRVLSDEGIVTDCPQCRLIEALKQLLGEFQEQFKDFCKTHSQLTLRRHLQFIRWS